MREKLTTIGVMGVAAAVILAMVGPAVAGPLAQSSLQGGAPTVVSYQGQVTLDGAPYTGDGYFKLAIVDTAGSISYWSNDGSSTGGAEPATAVQLAVSDGLFSVLLGDTTVAGMTQPLTASVFSQPDCYLRVWFSTNSDGPFEPLAPDTHIAAVPYALQAQAAVDADTVDGLHASELGTHYQSVIVVGQGGGDYASVQAAIDSITDATESNPYLVWVAPGLYEEQVTMKPHVHLQGAGQGVTVITSHAGSSAWPPDQATLLLASDTSLCNLTVQNTGVGDGNAALLAMAGMTRTLVAETTARALGSGVNNFAIAVVGSPTGVNLQQVAALAENGSNTNIGLLVSIGAGAVLRSGTLTARGGDRAWAAFASQSGTTLEASGVSMLAENASSNNTGMYSYDGAEAVLRGGDFTARGGLQTNAIADQLNSMVTAYNVTALAEDGITNYGLGAYDGAETMVRGASVIARGGESNYAVNSTFNGATLDAESVTALAEGGSLLNYGLQVAAGTAHATVRGGSFTGRGGQDARGIDCDEEEITLDAEGVTALGEGGSDANYGLHNANGAAATLRGGSVTGCGGAHAWGIHNAGGNTTLVAESVAVLGENASVDNYGLYSDNGAVAILRGGSFTGHGGAWAKGIYHSGAGTTLEAEYIAALGADGSSENFGLLVTNYDTVTVLRGGSFTARGGTFAYGIDNHYSGPMLEAEDVTAMGTDGSEANYGLRNAEGAHARLRGGAITAHWGITSCAIFNTDLETWLDVDNVSALAENGSDFNYGLNNLNGAGASLRGGSFIARWGWNSLGIHNTGSDTSMQAANVAARAELGSSINYGLNNRDGAKAVVHGGSFAAGGGHYASAVCNVGSDTTLEADNVSALGEGGSNASYGLINTLTAAARLHGGSFTGVGGGNAIGIYKNDGSTLEADNVTALGGNGTFNYGLVNYDSSAVLRSGTYTGRGGTHAQGIYNYDGSTLEADNVTALGENGGNFNTGLANYSTAALRGGAFTGRGGADAWGILNHDSGTTLEAENITVLGADATNDNYGLNNFSGTAVLRSGAFTGRGGTDAHGIFNTNSATLEASSVIALGKDGSSTNYGLKNMNVSMADVAQSVLEGATFSVHSGDGAVTVSNSRLAGNTVWGAVTCLAVSRGGIFNVSGCP
jgi:hypothetical protein